MKTVGIIGGLGPETTSRFYLELIWLCQKNNNLHRPPVIIWNVPITYNMEHNEITKGIYDKKFLQLLLDAAKKLERFGADFLVMPCNSSHTFFHEINDCVNIPILNIVQETIKYLKKNNISKIGIISSLITAKNKLYNSSLKANKIKFSQLENKNQKKINDIVLNLTRGNYSKQEKIALHEIINNFQKYGIEDIVLACAALEVLISKNIDINIHDTMKIYAAATAEYILGKQIK